MTTILVALDDSPRASHVLAKACQLARTLDASLTLLRVVGIPTDMPLEAYALSPEGVTTLLEERARAGLLELQKTIPTGVQSEVQVELGTPWQAICARGTSLKADLIILGSHGYSGIDHLLGTTAARVVNHADRSVLVVR